MLRYHIKIYRPSGTDQKLKDFTDQINQKQWHYSAHVLNHLKYRTMNVKHILTFIKDQTLNPDQIFEHYEDANGNIIKACYRLNYTKTFDLIAVINADKTLITLYMNDIADQHNTLRPELYQTGS